MQNYLEDYRNEILSFELPRRVDYKYDNRRRNANDWRASQRCGFFPKKYLH